MLTTHTHSNKLVYSNGEKLGCRTAMLSDLDVEYIRSQGLEDRLSRAIDQVMHEKPPDAVMRLSELLAGGANCRIRRLWNDDRSRTSSLAWTRLHQKYVLNM